MSKRIIALTLSFLMIIGSISPGNIAYAAEDAGEASSAVEASLELPDKDEDVQQEEETPAVPDVIEEEEAEPEEIPEEKPQAEEPEVVPEEPATEEISEETEEPEKPEEPLEEDTSADEAAPEVKELKLSMRDISLMYGESADNKDGHLDSLFGPKLTDADGTAYELAVKDKEYPEDALYFYTEYKFFGDESVFELLSSDELTIEEKTEIFEQISEIGLSTAPAGKSIYLAARAASSDGSFAFGTKKVDIKKRPVVLEFPTTEELVADAGSIPEEGYITVSASDEIFADISTIPFTEYVIYENDEEIRIAGSFDAALLPIAPENVFAGDIALDVTLLDYDNEGYQPAKASFEKKEDFEANYEIAEDCYWSVLVKKAEEEAVPEEEVREKSIVTGQENPDPLPGFDKNEVGFYDTEELRGVTFSSKYKEIKVEAYASKSANRKSPIFLGDYAIEYWPEEYIEEGDPVNAYKSKYWKANTIWFDPNELDATTYYIFGRFYTGEGTKGYVDSENTIVLYNVPANAPEIESLIGANATDVKNGKVTFTAPGKSEYLYIFKNGDTTNHYGDTDATDTIHKTEADGGALHFESRSLYPGQYRAAYCGISGATFISEMYCDSKWLDFVIPVREGYVTGLKVYDTHKDPDTEIVSLDLTKGDTLSLGYTVTTDGETDTGVTFTSSAPKILSVDSVGNCKAIKAGSAVITVTTTGKNNTGESIHKDIPVEVNNPDDMGHALFVVKSAKFKTNPVKHYLPSGNSVVLDISFDRNIQYTPVTWHVDNTEYAAVLDDESHENQIAILHGENGAAQATIKLKKPGKVVVTATIGGAKTIACDLYINGPVSGDSDAAYYYNGKYLTGLWAIDKTTREPVASGNNALKAKNAYIRYYYEAYPYVAREAVVRIGKKMYLFDKDAGYDLVKGPTKKALVATGYGTYVINTSGELQTGWIIPDGQTDQLYFDPDHGTQVKSGWVPRGKGITWVNENGLMLDADDKSLLEDGRHTLYYDGDYYTHCFKGGIMLTGLVYFKEDKITTAKKADTGYYFDPDGGKKVYNSFFYYGGKRYYARGDGSLPLNEMFTVTEEGVNYYYIGDSNGVVQVNKLISNIDAYTYYAGSDGRLVKNTTIVIKGKAYHFGDYYRLIESGEVLESPYTVRSGGAFKPVYMSASGTKAASNTQFFYDAGGKQKVKSAVLYKGDAIWFYLNDKGMAAAGPISTGEGIYFFDPETYVCVRDDSIVNIDGKYHDRVVSYKGKFYVCDKFGEVYTENDAGSSFLEIKYTEDAEKTYKYAGVKNAKGEIYTGIVTLNRKKYCFCDEDDNGIMASDSSIAFYKNKYYAINPGKDREDPASCYIDATGQNHITSNGYAVKPDGTMVLTGWFTAEGKRHYVTQGSARILGVVGAAMIGGKIYAFNPDGTAYSGWKLISTQIYDIDHFGSIVLPEPGYFYFNPRSYTAETGWKTMYTLKIAANGEVESKDGVPVSSNLKKKIYFNTSDATGIPRGFLIRNMDYAVGGKTYRFNADGSVMSGKAGFAGNDVLDGDIENINSYVKADGTKATGRTLIKSAQGDRYFYFALADGIKETNVLRKTGKKWYFYGDNGQMLTSLTAKEQYNNGTAITDGVSVNAAFNSDGSIKGFTAANNTGLMVRNTVIKLGSGEIYVLGSDGLPTTGFVYCGALNATIYVASDGRNTGTYAPAESTVKPELIKIGTKYYVMKEGVPYNKYGSIAVAALDLSSLSYADQIEINAIKGLRWACYYSNDLYIRYTPGGAVASGEMRNADGYLRHYNKFGMEKESISVFTKVGSAWYFTKGANLYYNDIDAYEYATKTTSKIILSSDSNGKLLPVTDTETGKKLNGVYEFRVPDGTSVVACFKGGKLVTGKKKVIFDRVFNITFDIPAEYGCTISNFG